MRCLRLCPALCKEADGLCNSVLAYAQHVAKASTSAVVHPCACRQARCLVVAIEHSDGADQVLHNKHQCSTNRGCLCRKRCWTGTPTAVSRESWMHVADVMAVVSWWMCRTCKSTASCKLCTNPARELESLTMGFTVFTAVIVVAQLQIAVMVYQE